MQPSQEALRIQNQLHEPRIKLGDLRKMAKEIKKNHSLAMELWSAKEFPSRQLAILIMDPKMLTQEVIIQLDQDIQLHPQDEQLHLIDWLMANQLSKDKNTIDLMLSWEDSTSYLQRRTFWYYQARLRWVGQTPPSNTEKLLTKIEKHIESELPSVQWAMNFTAAQIGIFEEDYRNRCIEIGAKTGLYKDEVVPKNCTPNYLPDFISIQVAKLKK
jgi:3-methyladenine DNA glycosylase AlkD